MHYLYACRFLVLAYRYTPNWLLSIYQLKLHLINMNEISNSTLQACFVSVTFNDSAGKGKQMLPGGSKERSTGLQAGYFNEKYNRVFEGESYSDPIRLKRIFRMKESKKNLGKPFMPTNAEKTM